MIQLFEQHRREILVSAIVTIVITGALAASAIYILSNNVVQKENSPILAGPQSHLILQLTDPPVVPRGTSTLTLTYDRIELLIAWSGTTSQNTIAVSPSSGDTTLNLLSLQNVSRTLEAASVPTGAEILSASFILSEVEITVNGTSYPVTLATGGNSLVVALPNLVVSSGNNALLLELNPTIVKTSTGYELLPSSIGVLKPSAEITTNDEKTGYTHMLSVTDQNELHHAKGSISAQLLAFSVSGTTTTINLQITDTGKLPEQLIIFGFHGDFDSVCPATTSTSGDSTSYNNRNDEGCSHGSQEVFFIPGAPQTTIVSTTYSGCAPRHMTFSNDLDGRNNVQITPIVMNQAQCLNFEYSSSLTLGGGSHSHIIVPSTQTGAKYVVHVVATNGAELKLKCTLHGTTAPTCSPDHDDNDED